MPLIYHIIIVLTGMTNQIVIISYQIEMEVKIICMILCMVGIYCKDLPFTNIPYTSSFYSCMRQTGYDQAILVLDSEFKDSSIVDIRNAKNAGLKVHVFYLLCKTKKLSELGQQFIKYFGNNTLENVWLFANHNSSSDPNCTWANSSGQQNCEHLKQIMEGLKKYNITASTIIYKEYWTSIFGSISACPELSNFLSWWIPQQHDEQDFQPNFNSYKQPVGGWQKPFMKLYNTRQICGQTVFINYYE